MTTDDRSSKDESTRDLAIRMRQYCTDKIALCAASAIEEQADEIERLDSALDQIAYGSIAEDEITGFAQNVLNEKTRAAPEIQKEEPAWANGTREQLIGQIRRLRGLLADALCAEDNTQKHFAEYRRAFETAQSSNERLTGVAWLRDTASTYIDDGEFNRELTWAADEIERLHMQLKMRPAPTADCDCGTCFVIRQMLDGLSPETREREDALFYTRFLAIWDESNKRRLELIERKEALDTEGCRELAALQCVSGFVRACLTPPLRTVETNDAGLLELLCWARRCLVATDYYRDCIAALDAVIAKAETGVCNCNTSVPGSHHAHDCPQWRDHSPAQKASQPPPHCDTCYCGEYVDLPSEKTPVVHVGLDEQPHEGRRVDCAECAPDVDWDAATKRAVYAEPSPYVGAAETDELQRLRAVNKSLLDELHHHFGCDPECEKRHAQKTSEAPAEGVTIRCSTCPASLLLPYTDATKKSVALAPLDNWEGPPMQCPACASLPRKARHFDPSGQDGGEQR